MTDEQRAAAARMDAAIDRVAFLQIYDRAGNGDLRPIASDPVKMGAYVDDARAWWDSHASGRSPIYAAFRECVIADACAKEVHRLLSPPFVAP